MNIAIAAEESHHNTHTHTQNRQWFAMCESEKTTVIRTNWHSPSHIAVACERVCPPFIMARESKIKFCDGEIQSGLFVISIAIFMLTRHKCHENQT